MISTKKSILHVDNDAIPKSPLHSQYTDITVNVVFLVVLHSAFSHSVLKIYATVHLMY